MSVTQIQIISTEPAIHSIIDSIIDNSIKMAIQKYLPLQVAQQQPMRPDNDHRFDILGLAEYLKCSIQTIHNLKKEGVLPFYRLGRKIYFKKSEVDNVARVKSIYKFGEISNKSLV